MGVNPEEVGLVNQRGLCRKVRQACYAPLEQSLSITTSTSSTRLKRVWNVSNSTILISSSVSLFLHLVLRHLSQRLRVMQVTALTTTLPLKRLWVSSYLSGDTTHRPRRRCKPSMT